MTSIHNPRSKGKIISDLIWARDSVPIYLGGDVFDLREFLKKLSQIDVQHCAFEIDDGKWFSGRLGRYFESLFAVLLKQHPDMIDLAQNVVVKSKSQTIGEFDFLCETADAILHFEIAVKFFLKAELNGVFDFWGPRKRDYLSGKLSRMHEHQLQLELPEKWKLKEKPLKRFGLMKGYLFYPWQSFIEMKFEFPNELEPQHQRGWWIPRSAVDHIVGNGIEFLCPTKLDWLSFAAMQDSKKMNEMELRKYLMEATQLSDNYNDAMLVTRVDGNGKELDRGFIVDDMW